MPVDSRRIQGPESCIPYENLRKPEKNTLLRKGKRDDKRNDNEARQIFMKTGLISQAKGSAYIEQGKTKIICAVYGPREVSRSAEFSLKGQLSCEFKFAPFSCKIKKGHQPDNEEMEMSRILQECLEPVVCLNLFPKALVEVNILVLENDGAVLAAAVTCASLALADGNIPTYDLVVGSSLRQNQDRYLLDPSSEEEWGADKTQTGEKNSNVMIGYMPNLQQVCTYLHEGSVTAEDLENAMTLLVENCKQILPLMQDCLKKSVEMQLTENQ